MDFFLLLLLPNFHPQSPHNTDLRRYATTWLIVLVLVIPVAVFLVLSWHGRCDKGSYDFIASVCLAVGGVALSKIQAAGEAANRREGVVDIFFSDIVSICAVMYSLRLPDPYVWRYARLSDASGSLPRPGEENYVNVFNDKCADLVLLRQEVVRKVTAFYRYFLSARDATRRLAPWATMTEDERRVAVQAVMLQLWLCLRRAQDAIHALDAHRAAEVLPMVKSMVGRCEEFLIDAEVDPELLRELGWRTVPG